MKTKQILSGLLCGCMLLGACLPVMAEEISSTGPHRVTVNYGLEETFIVNIPADINFDSSGNANVIVSIENASINPDSNLNIVISSENYDGSYHNLINTIDANSKVGYIMRTDDIEYVKNDDIILSVDSDTKNSSTTLMLVASNVPDKAGNYVDTLTFTVNIDGKVFVAGLYDNQGELITTWENAAIDEELSNIKSVLSNHSNATKIVVPGTVGYIGSVVFEDVTSIEEIVIENGVTGIGNQSFNNMTNLKVVRLPNTIESMSYRPFSGCTNLESIYYDGTVTQFNNISKGDDWYMAAGSFKVYCSDGVLSFN